MPTPLEMLANTASLHNAMASQFIQAANYVHDEAEPTEPPEDPKALRHSLDQAIATASHAEHARSALWELLLAQAAALLADHSEDEVREALGESAGAMPSVLARASLVSS